MANDPLEFVRIEETIAAHILSSFEAMLGDTVSQIEHKCTAGDFSGAYAIINGLDLTGLIESKRVEFEKQAISAALFGASEVVPLSETDMVKTLNVPREVFNAVDQLVIMMETHVAEMIRDDLRATVRNFELDAKDELFAVSKDDLSTLYMRWNEARNENAGMLRAYLDRREQAELAGNPFLTAVNLYAAANGGTSLGVLQDAAFAYGHLPWQDRFGHGPATLQVTESLRPTLPVDTGIDSLQRKAFLYSHGGIGEPPQNAENVIVGDKFTPSALQLDNSSTRSSEWSLQSIFKDAPPYQDDDKQTPNSIASEDDAFDDTTGWSRAVANPPVIPLPKRKTQKADVSNEARDSKGRWTATGDEVATASAFESKTHLSGHGFDLPLIEGKDHHAAIKFYHGTSSQFIKDIKAHGLTIGHTGGADDVARQGGNIKKLLKRTPSVYVSAVQGAAENYARVTAERSGGKPVIFTVNVPVSKLKDFVEDEYGNATYAIRTEQHIPKEWIGEVIKQSAKDGLGRPIFPKQKEETKTLYFITFVNDGEDVSKEEARDALGRWTSGPLFHGSPAKDKISTEGFKVPSDRRQIYGKGVYLTDSHDMASKFGDVVSVDASGIQNPKSFASDAEYEKFGKSFPVQARIKELESQGRRNVAPQAETDVLQSMGYDSHVVNRSSGNNVFVVYDPSKLKLANVQKEEPRDARGRWTLGSPVKSTKSKSTITIKGKEVPVKGSPDDPDEVGDASFNHPKVIGPRTMKVADLKGGVSLNDPDQRRRVDELKAKITSDDGHISRLLADTEGNVLEGQHRLEALRELGAKEAPVHVIQDLAAGLNEGDLTKVARDAQPMHSDHVNQIVTRVLDAVSESGSPAKAREEWEAPRGFEKAWNALLDHVEKQGVKKDDLTEGDLAATGGLLNPEQAGAKRRKRKKFIRAVKAALALDTLYVHRPLLNTSSQALIEWAKENGFTSTLDPSDMHVTICYSKSPVAAVAPDVDHLTVDGGAREIEQFGKATVLHFTSPELADRNFLLSLLGATSDFDQYRSHVTISYDGAPDDATQLVPFDGPLEFGSEIHAPINEDWRDSKVEAAIKADAAQTALAMQMNAATLGTGKKLFDIGANLTTSRLIAFGFLDQAAKAGMTTYQVNEILDEKTCPVCVFMNGKTFVVPHEYGKVLQALGTSDPQQLKSIAPWPSQSKAGLAALYGMTPAEMQSSGYGSPPYHPRCRGYLSIAGSVKEMIPTGTLAAQVQAIIDGLQPEEDSGLVPLGETIQESADGADEPDAIEEQTLEDNSDDDDKVTPEQNEALDVVSNAINPAFDVTSNYVSLAENGDNAAHALFVDAANMVADDKAHSRITSLIEAEDYEGAAKELEAQGVDLGDLYNDANGLQNEVGGSEDDLALSPDKLNFYENSTNAGSPEDEQLTAAIATLQPIDYANAVFNRTVGSWEALDAILWNNGIDVTALSDGVTKYDADEPRDTSGKWVRGATVIRDDDNKRSPMAVYLTPHAAESVSDALNETSDGDLNAEVHDAIIPADVKVGDTVYVNFNPKKGKDSKAKVYRNAKEAADAQNSDIEDNWKKYGPLLSPNEDMTQEQWDKGWKAWAYDHPNDPDGENTSSDDTEEGDKDYGKENIDAYLRLANGYAPDEKKPYPGPIAAHDYFDDMDQEEHKVFSAKTKIRKFDSDEPRDKSGRWTNGGGSAGDSDNIMSHDDLRAAMWKVADDLGFPKGRVIMSDDEYPFSVDGKSMVAAATANTSDPRGLITVYRKHVTPSTLTGVMAHEVEHMKFADKLRELSKEKDAIEALSAKMDSEGIDPWKTLRNYRDELRPPYDKQFPVYDAMSKAYQNVDKKVFAQSDGVSSYSKQYWDGWHNGNVSTEAAVHETLAEMHRIKLETGKFPEHQFSGPLPRHNKSKEYPEGFATTRGVPQILADGAKAWRKLYRIVNP